LEAGPSTRAAFAITPSTGHRAQRTFGDRDAGEGFTLDLNPYLNPYGI
jgi:hypothetical protein